MDSDYAIGLSSVWCVLYIKVIFYYGNDLQCAITQTGYFIVAFNLDYYDMSYDIDYILIILHVLRVIQPTRG